MPHEVLTGRYCLTPYGRRLVEQNMPLVGTFLRQETAGSGLERADRLQCAYIGLIKAVVGYDPRRGCTFSTYAYRCIRNTLIYEQMYDRLIYAPIHSMDRTRADGTPEARAAAARTRRVLSFSGRGGRAIRDPVDRREPADLLEESERPARLLARVVVLWHALPRGLRSLLLPWSRRSASPRAIAGLLAILGGPDG